MDPRDEALAADRRRQEQLQSIRKTARSAETISQLQAENRLLREELGFTERRLEVALKLDERRAVKVESFKAPAAGKHDAAFLLMCSDWHVGERVDPESVSGRNSYSPMIAKKRVKNLIEGALWMIEAWRSGPKGYGWGIDTAIIWLGGDLITGMIHDDLRESNYLSPSEEVLLASELAAEAIASIKAHPGIKRVVVPTSWGNHGRDTPERRVSTSWKRSYEWLMYRQLALRFPGEVLVGQDEVSRLRIYDWKLRFAHGDQFGFQGGVGGITIPANKWIARLDGTEPAHYTFIGHWHQALDTGKLVVNNCLIGWGAYAQRVAPYAPPSQVCCLIDAKRGKRLTTEIFV